MKQTPKGACDRGVWFMEGRCGWAGGGTRRTEPGEGASFGRGRAGYGALP